MNILPLKAIAEKAHCGLTLFNYKDAAQRRVDDIFTVRN